MHPMNNLPPVQNATPLSDDEAIRFYYPTKKSISKRVRPFLRTLSCVSIAMSLLLTSVQLPVRQAEALVSPAAASVISYALVMDQLTSTKQPPELLRQATQQCIKTFNTAKFLSSTHREEIKKAWCGSTAVGGTLEQIGLLINTVCGFREKCLADLQKTLDRLLKSLGTKNVINFQPLCTVLITLFGQSIESYCAANGFTGGTSIVSQPPKGPPSKGGNGTNKTSSTQPPSPNFLTGLLSRVQSAIEKVWNDCKNIVIRLINPKCKPSPPLLLESAQRKRV